MLRDVLGDDRPLVAAPQLAHDQLLIACRSPQEAAAQAERIRAAWPAGAAPRIGGDYGICHGIDDPFAGARRIHGRAPILAAEAMRSTPPGSACVTGDFAAALAASGAPAHTEFVGELTGQGEEPISLYSLRPALGPA